MAFTTEFVLGVGNEAGVIAPPDPVPLYTHWVPLGEVRLLATGRAIFSAKLEDRGSSGTFGLPRPQIRWRETGLGTTFVYEFQPSVSVDPLLLVDLPAGTWAAEISGVSSSDRTAYTYSIIAAAAPPS